MAAQTAAFCSDSFLLDPSRASPLSQVSPLQVWVPPGLGRAPELGKAVTGVTLIAMPGPQ